MAMQVSVIQKQILKDSKNINSFSESLKKMCILGHTFKSTLWKIPPNPEYFWVFTYEVLS